MYKNLIFILLLAFNACTAQVPADLPKIENEAFDKEVQSILSFTVPLKGVKELSEENLEEYVILDAREIEEFEVSHIEDAQCVGYDDFKLSSIENIDKNQKIIIYCSVGYRSEKIGEKLQKAGYTNVYNLYGSIFEWVNQGNSIVDNSGETTNQIHTYNKTWSRWVFNKWIKKIW